MDGTHEARRESRSIIDLTMKREVERRRKAAGGDWSSPMCPVLLGLLQTPAHPCFSRGLAFIRRTRLVV